MVLHVQEQWRDHRSFATLLWLCTRIMVFDSMSFWSPLGYAGSGFVGVGTLVNIVLLIYGGGHSTQCYVDHLEREKPTYF